MRRLVGSCVVGLVLAAASLSAARSDVADAAMAGDMAAVRTLLAQRADVNARPGRWGDGPALGGIPAGSGDGEPADSCRRECEGGEPRGITPLALACINGHAGMIEALLKAGADANERLMNGETALMMASRTGNVAAMTVLLDHGADLNAREPLHGTTPLMWAAAEGHPDAIRLLIARGADVSARSNPDYRFRGPRNAGGGRPADPRKCADTTVVCDAAQKQRERDRVLDNQTPGPPDFTDRSGGGLTPLVFARGATTSPRCGFCWPPAPM